MKEEDFRQLWQKLADLESSKSSSTYKTIEDSAPQSAGALPLFTISEKATLDQEVEQKSDTISGEQTIDGENNTISGEQTLDKSKEDDKATILHKDTVEKNVLPSTRVEESDTAATSYEIFSEIAHGGMGIVFKGRQHSLKRDIAIKKLLPEISSTKMKEKFVSEAIVTAFLDHPNVVPIHELGQNEMGEVLLAMKLVGGTSWKELLQKKKEDKYNFLFHMQILLNVCNAICYAHSKGIIHNDLKPENVMVGEFGEVLVMDWGIAVDIREEISANVGILHRSLVKNPM